MKMILRLIIISILAFVILKATTFGWRFWGKASSERVGENEQLVGRLKEHVYKLAADIGERSVFQYAKLEEAAGYITGQLRSLGYNVEFQKYTASGHSVKNIIATKVGTTRSQEFVLVGAHYDTCFNPGADDNASGISALLELARFISDRETACSIKFIAFVNEEPPFFKTEEMGSRVYTREAKKRGEDIKAVLILESIGYYSDKPGSQRYPLFFGPFYPNKGNFITVVGNFPSRWLVRSIVNSFKRSKTLFPIESVTTFNFISGVDFSDHWSFWQEGYPAVMITDTAFYRNPDYHFASDTYEKLNYRSLAEVAKGLSSVLSDLAN